MLVYFDPDSFIETETRGEITCINAADASDRHQVVIETEKQAKLVSSAIRDQITHGLAGREGRFKKIRGIFQSLPDAPTDGIITAESGRETPVRLGFDLAGGSLPKSGVCIAVGDYVDGALFIEKIAIAPIAPIPSVGPNVQPEG